MNSKKRKLSGLSGIELRLAYERLLELKKTFLFEESEGTAITDRDNFEQQVETTLSLMKSRLEDPQVCFMLTYIFSSDLHEVTNFLQHAASTVGEVEH
jgi:hypothetical protein